MNKAYFCFGTSFFILAITGTLLLTWTVWWVSMVGNSVPARRPFFRPSSTLPELIFNENDVGKPVYEYTLQGGWPTFNSIVRLITSILAVVCAFSFATIAAIVPHRAARRIFTASLLVVIILAIVSAILDAVAIARAGTECASGECTSAVPQIVLDSPNKCNCAVEGWFYVTLLADVVLCFTALICFVITARPFLAASAAAPPKSRHTTIPTS